MAGYKVGDIILGPAESRAPNICEVVNVFKDEEGEEKGVKVYRVRCLESNRTRLIQENESAPIEGRFIPWGLELYDSVHPITTTLIAHSNGVAGPDLIRRIAFLLNTYGLEDNNA